MSDLQVPEIERLCPVFQRGPDEASNMEPHPDGGYVEFQVVTQLQDRIEELEDLLLAANVNLEVALEGRDRAEQENGWKELRRDLEMAEARIAEQEEALRVAISTLGQIATDLDKGKADDRTRGAALTNTKGSSDGPTES